jgi:NADPH-dependent curcumin reductase CurA
VPAPGEGEVVLKHLSLSLDPYQRGRRSDATPYPPPMLRDGRLKCREDVVEGLDATPAPFVGLLQRRNFGKLLACLPD